MFYKGDCVMALKGIKEYLKAKKKSKSEEDEE